MAGLEEYKHAIDDDDEDDEKASLKAQTENSKKQQGLNNNAPINSPNNNQKSFSPNNKIPKTTDSSTNAPPSLTRRMSSQFVYQVERQKSVVDNIGLTDKINQVVPDEITRHIPGLNRRQSQLKLTYFCNICFSKNSIDQGFTLRKCQHQFCPECLQ
eukprot:863053_1